MDFNDGVDPLINEQAYLSENHMTYSVEIRIFGKLSDPKPVLGLAEAMAQESSLNARDDINTEKFLKMIEAANSSGRPIVLERLGYDDVFYDIEAACQEADLSYVRIIGESGSDGPTNGVAWKPGADEEYTFYLNEHGPTVPLAEIINAAKKGIDAVNTLVETVSSMTKIGKIEMEPGFIEAFKVAQDEDYESNYGPRM